MVNPLLPLRGSSMYLYLLTISVISNESSCTDHVKIHQIHDRQTKGQPPTTNNQVGHKVREKNTQLANNEIKKDNVFHV